MNYSRNIILLSHDVYFATKVAREICREFGFIRARVNSKKGGEHECYTVSICSEMIDYDTLCENGYVIDLAEFNNKDTECVADDVFDRACDHFLGHLSAQEMLEQCA